MIGSKMRKFSILLLLAIMILVPVACGNGVETSRWDEAEEASGGGQATSDEALPGSAFNELFPESGDGFDIVFTQEKTGFAEAKLEMDGDEIATLSISDTLNNLSALEKFQESNETLGGYPVADVGSKGTAILVADRFQVQVRSKVDDFEQGDREFWLLEFDLDGLSKLQ